MIQQLDNLTSIPAASKGTLPQKLMRDDLSIESRRSGKGRLRVQSFNLNSASGQATDSIEGNNASSYGHSGDVKNAYSGEGDDDDEYVSENPFSSSPFAPTPLNELPRVLRLGHPARLTDAVVKYCLDSMIVQDEVRCTSCSSSCYCFYYSSFPVSKPLFPCH